MLKNIKIFLFLWLTTFVLKANAQSVRVETDRQNIKIGEQIQYKILVENADNEFVAFPDGQTFLPMEMVTASAVDTLKENGKIKLSKNYFITNFESGSYTIPSQRIRIASNDFFTDSLAVKVETMAVDTISKPLFDIKPIQEVVSNSKSSNYIWIIVGILVFLAVGFLVYFFIFRKKKLSEEEKIALLPPFDRAILGLKNLQNSKYLIESKHKEYYSELTDIVRAYLEEEVQILAKESTTDELLTKINLLQEAGKLNLSADTISNLKRVLQNADLVKFAKEKPSDTSAEYDRETIEDVVIKTKNAIPVEAEQADISLEEITKSLQKQRKKKAIKVTAIVVSCCILAFVFVNLFFAKSLNINHLYFWQKSATISELSQEKWVTSDYGYPVTELSTPKVLKRKTLSLSSSYDNITDKKYIFASGEMSEHFYVMTSVFTFKQQPDNQQELTLDPEKITNTILSELEKIGAKNISTFQEEYTTNGGAKGIKVFGKMTMQSADNEPFNAVYELYSFTENGALQQLFISYIDQPEAEILATKVVNSVNFKKD